MDVTVIICCYNSKQRLKPTLEHLAKQVVPVGFGWNVVLVDNNSTDGTAQFVHTIWNDLDCNVPLKVVHEPQQGLSHARKKGIFEASGEIVIFCDDDNWLFPDYVEKAYKIMRNNPEIGIAAGIGIAVSDIRLPDWLNDFEKKCYACGQYHDYTGDITFKKWVWGAGMVIRKLVLLNLYKAGVTHQTTDRNKNSLASGGDREICFWFILSGYKLWYDLDLKFYHYLSEIRLSSEYFKELRIEQQKSSDLILPQYLVAYAYLKINGKSISYYNSFRYYIRRILYNKHDYRYLFTFLRHFTLSKKEKDLKKLLTMIYKSN